MYLVFLLWLRVCALNRGNLCCHWIGLGYSNDGNQIRAIDSLQLPILEFQTIFRLEFILMKSTSSWIEQGKHFLFFECIWGCVSIYRSIFTQFQRIFTICWDPSIEMNSLFIPIQRIFTWIIQNNQNYFGETRVITCGKERQTAYSFLRTFWIEIFD